MTHTFFLLAQKFVPKFTELPPKNALHSESAIRAAQGAAVHSSSSDRCCTGVPAITDIKQELR